MNTERIELLIRKYEDCTASLREEEELREIFLSGSYPPEYKYYAGIFRFFEKEKQLQIPDQDFDDRIIGMIEDQHKSISLRRRWPALAAAAMIVILLSVWMGGLFRSEPAGQPTADTYQDPEKALLEARKILLAVSSNMNKGLGEVATVRTFNEGIGQLARLGEFDHGLQKIEKVSLLDKSKKTITKTN